MSQSLGVNRGRLTPQDRDLMAQDCDLDTLVIRCRTESQDTDDPPDGSRSQASVPACPPVSLGSPQVSARTLKVAPFRRRTHSPLPGRSFRSAAAQNYLPGPLRRVFLPVSVQQRSEPHSVVVAEQGALGEGERGVGDAVRDQPSAGRQDHAGVDDRSDVLLGDADQ